MAEGKSNRDIDNYQTYLPPPQLGKWDGFKQFLWNSDSKEFLGRTGSSWFKVTVFYIIFYICLAAFFAIMLVIFYQTLDYYEPKWTQGDSLIGTNPGLGFRPMPEKNVESTLIWFQRGGGNPNKWIHWSKSLDKFLDPYDFGKQYGHTFKQCSDSDPIGPNKVCHFNLHDLGKECIKEKYYGYDQNHPCVVIKMNKIWGWVPEPYGINDPLPNEMSQSLKNRIQEARNNGSKSANNMVWLDCQGENPADRENMGELEYFPHPGGFPTYFFPFINTPGYLAPIVMIRFKSLQPGILINIECKAWAKNIKHSRMERRGSVHFEMLMD